MSGGALVAAVVGAFFLIGVGVGVVAVIAASALRTDGERNQRRRANHDRAIGGHGNEWPGNDWPGGWTDTTGAGWEEPPVLDEDDDDNPPPRWPGGR